MMTYKEIWSQLNDIHTEFVGEITPEQLEAAWAEGQANPCGCSICHLMEAVTIAEITEGQVEVGDVYPGLCCAGYNWEVSLIFPGSVPAYNSIWGTCGNPACTGRDGNGTDHYQGVSSWLQEDFEERLASAEPEGGAAAS